MKTIIYPLLLIPLWFTSPNINTDSNDLPSGMKKNNQSLFYIERSKNRNRVYYDANFNSNGSLNIEHPIDAYWLNLEKDYGKREEMNFIEEKFAYGYKSKKINDKMFEIKLKAYSERPLILFLDYKSKAKLYAVIKGKQAYLHCLYVKATDRGLATKVQYVELFGVDIQTKKEMYEKIIP